MWRRYGGDIGSRRLVPVFSRFKEWSKPFKSPDPPKLSRNSLLTAGVSSVSSESTYSRKSSLARDFSFSSLSNFQNVNLLNKSQIPRSTVSKRYQIIGST